MTKLDTQYNTIDGQIIGRVNTKDKGHNVSFFQKSEPLSTIEKVINIYMFMCITFIKAKMSSCLKVNYVYFQKETMCTRVKFYGDLIW